MAKMLGRWLSAAIEAYDELQVDEMAAFTPAMRTGGFRGGAILGEDTARIRVQVARERVRRNSLLDVGTGIVCHYILVFVNVSIAPRRGGGANRRLSPTYYRACLNDGGLSAAILPPPQLRSLMFARHSCRLTTQTQSSRAL